MSALYCCWFYFIYNIIFFMFDYLFHSKGFFAYKSHSFSYIFIFGERFPEFNWLLIFSLFLIFLFLLLFIYFCNGILIFFYFLSSCSFLVYSIVKLLFDVFIVNFDYSLYINCEDFPYIMGFFLILIICFLVVLLYFLIYGYRYGILQRYILRFYDILDAFLLRRRYIYVVLSYFFSSFITFLSLFFFIFVYFSTVFTFLWCVGFLYDFFILGRFYSIIYIVIFMFLIGLMRSFLYLIKLYIDSEISRNLLFFKLHHVKKAGKLNKGDIPIGCGISVSGLYLVIYYQNEVCEFYEILDFFSNKSFYGKDLYAKYVKFCNENIDINYRLPLFYTSGIFLFKKSVLFEYYVGLNFLFKSKRYVSIIYNDMLLFGLYLFKGRLVFLLIFAVIFLLCVVFSYFGLIFV